MFEKKVIGLCLQEPDKINVVDERVFLNNTNKQIMLVLKKLANDNKSIDLPFVSAYITNHDYEISQVYLSECYETIIHSSNFESNYKELIKNWQKYELTRYTNDLHEKMITLDEFIEKQNEIIEMKYEHEDKFYHIGEVFRGEKYRESQTFITGVIPFLDNKDGGLRKELVYLAARPSVGKTAMAKQIAINALNNNLEVGFFSAEMAKEKLVKQMVCNRANVEITKYDMGLISQREASQIDSTMEWFDRRKMYIDDTPNIDIDLLCYKAKLMKRRHDIKILFVDYLQLLKRKGKLIGYEKITENSMQMKELQRQLDIPVICLAQLSRNADNKEPTFSDLKGSGQIEQDADVLMFLHPQEQNEHYQDRLKVMFSKNRNGNTGYMDMIFNKPYGQIREGRL